MVTPTARLNENLRLSIAARNLSAVKRLIWDCYQALLAAPRTPVPAGEPGSLWQPMRERQGAAT